MITGLHAVIFSKDAERDRAFFQDILKFSYVDAGEGWLIFAAPPSEIAFHPSEANDKHQVYLLCDDVAKQVVALVKAGCECAAIKDEGWGLFTSFTLPGGGSVGLYQPRHARPSMKKGFSVNEYIKDEIKYSTFVRAPMEQVYDGITTADGLDGWFTRGAEVDARPGGEIVFRWEDFGAERVTAVVRGPVLQAERPTRFVFKWHADNDPIWASTVEITFENVDGGTLICLREYGYPDTPQGLHAMLNCAAGWGEALTLWKFYLEHGLRY